MIWLHAVSVGEVVAATELIREMRKALPDWVIAVSTTTETGQKLARERLGGESPVFYLPLDFAVLARRYLKALHPELLVLMESELWPNLMKECANAGIPIAVINARISDRSFPRYRRLKALWTPLLKHVSLFLAQSEETASRLIQIGAPAERVHTSGNLKYDIRATDETAMTVLLREKILVGTKVLVAGSTLEGEEKMLLEAWTKVLEITPGAVLILAPRRTERFDIVGGLVEAAGFDVVRAGKLQPGELSLGQEGVILLDTIGDLASVYSLGTAAFVGGSLVPMGGHNPLEPARFGVPVIMGESWENFREIIASMQAAKAVHIIAAPDLANAITEMLTNEDRAKEMGRRGQAVFTAQAGATRRTLDALVGLLDRG